MCVCVRACVPVYLPRVRLIDSLPHLKLVLRPVLLLHALRDRLPRPRIELLLGPLCPPAAGVLRLQREEGVAVEVVADARQQQAPRLGERERGWAEADRAVDRAARRFGSAAVRPASLLG